MKSILETVLEYFKILKIALFNPVGLQISVNFSAKVVEIFNIDPNLTLGEAKTAIDRITV